MSKKNERSNQAKQNTTQNEIVETIPDTVVRFTIFKRVPIGSDLNVDRFIEAINEMEAVLNAVFQTGIIAAIQADLIPADAEVKSEAS